MDFSTKSGNINNWMREVSQHCPALAKEVNRMRFLYSKALDKRGQSITASEHFAVIAVHRPDLVCCKNGVFESCRCYVAWTGGDFDIQAVTTIVKKHKPLEVQEVTKKVKKVLKKKKKLIVS